MATRADRHFTDINDEDYNEPDPIDVCADCGAGFDEEHDEHCVYAGTDDDDDEIDGEEPDADELETEEFYVPHARADRYTW